MRLADILSRSGRSLRTAKTRTILTSLAIAVGAFTLTLTLAAGNGIRAYTDRLVADNFDPTESIVGRDKEIENNGPFDAAPKEYDESVGSIQAGATGGSVQLKQITDKDIEQLRKLSYVEQVRPAYQLNARYLTREGHKRYTVSMQTYNPGQRPTLSAGQLPQTGDVATGKIVLPDSYVSLLGFASSSDAIGKTVQLNIAQPFTATSAADILSQIQAGSAPQTVNKTVELTIAAVSKQPATSLPVSTPSLMVSSKDARDIYDYTAKGTQDYGRYLYAFVRVKGGADKAVADRAKANLKDMGYFVQTSQDIQQTITQFVNVLQILVAVFGAITVVASVFGIINTMYISVLERTREIGLMKALGMSGRDVGWLFRVEAAWIGFLGGVLGAGAAIVLGVALNPWLTEKLDLGQENSILIFSLVQVIVLIATLTLIAILAGWFPSRKAARLDPIEALRTE
jgi:putative ABC transport system permease protein